MTVKCPDAGSVIACLLRQIRKRKQPIIIERANMIEIKTHTEGDSRVSESVPTFTEFCNANVDHRKDVKKLIMEFSDMLAHNALEHDYTKTTEPYASMFYRDLCATIEGRMDFFDGEWSKLHYNVLERHHLKRHCPDDVNMLDVIEMICDCVAAGMARSGEVYDVDIPAEVLNKAVKNTVELLKSHIQVID